MIVGNGRGDVLASDVRYLAFPVTYNHGEQPPFARSIEYIDELLANTRSERGSILPIHIPEKKKIAHALAVVCTDLGWYGWEGDDDLSDESVAGHVAEVLDRLPMSDSERHSPIACLDMSASFEPADLLIPHNSGVWEGMKRTRRQIIAWNQQDDGLPCITFTNRPSKT